MEARGVGDDSAAVVGESNGPLLAAQFVSVSQGCRDEIDRRAVGGLELQHRLRVGWRPLAEWSQLVGSPDLKKRVAGNACRDVLVLERERELPAIGGI